MTYKQTHMNMHGVTCTCMQTLTHVDMRAHTWTPVDTHMDMHTLTHTLMTP